MRIMSWAREMTARTVADQVAVMKKEAIAASRWTIATCSWSRIDALDAGRSAAVDSGPTFNVRYQDALEELRLEGNLLGARGVEALWPASRSSGILLPAVEGCILSKILCTSLSQLQRGSTIGGMEFNYGVIGDFQDDIEKRRTGTGQTNS